MVSTEVLRRQPIFAGASEVSLKQLAMTSEARAFEPDEILFRSGERAERLFIVTRGEVDIRYTLNNHRVRIVDTLVAGDLLGWSAMVEPFRMTADAVARRRTELLVFDSAVVREACEADLALGYRVMREVARVMSHRLQGARVQLATVA